ncbi:MAG TPA: hypothetical protein VFM70_06535 [Salinimicrobium sp.]|nr:hypothetical protein [Salinimicrobium sp.]
MNYKILSLILFFCVLQISCTNAHEDDFLQDENPENLTYHEQIKPIIDNNCIICHNNPPVNAAPMSLVEYEDVKQAVLERGLLDRIQKQQGETGAMPLGGPRLPQTLIDQIINWAEQGFPE